MNQCKNCVGKLGGNATHTYSNVHRYKPHRELASERQYAKVNMAAQRQTRDIPVIARSGAVLLRVGWASIGQPIRSTTGERHCSDMSAPIACASRRSQRLARSRGSSAEERHETRDITIMSDSCQALEAHTHVNPRARCIASPLRCQLIWSPVIPPFPAHHPAGPGTKYPRTCCNQCV